MATECFSPNGQDVKENRKRRISDDGIAAPRENFTQNCRHKIAFKIYLYLASKYKDLKYLLIYSLKT